MLEHDNICPYLDIPIQHAAEGILKRMGRRYHADDLLHLFDGLRREMPDVALRTTVLVGFPGEGDDDFKKLKGFVNQVGFDHLGVFTYSDAEDLPSHGLDGHVASEVAEARCDELMALQRDISARNLTRYLGRTLKVLIEAQEEDGYWMGRTVFQAPEVDGVTFVRPPGEEMQIAVGEVVAVRIVEAMDYDLIAEVI